MAAAQRFRATKSLLNAPKSQNSRYYGANATCGVCAIIPKYSRFREIETGETGFDLHWVAERALQFAAFSPHGDDGKRFGVSIRVRKVTK
jgi:hypothetical protein